MKDENFSASSRINISSGAPWEAVVGYSRAVRTGPLLEVAGTTAMKDGEVQFPGDAAKQTAFVLETIQKAIEDAGGSIDQVVRTRMYVTNIAEWEAIGREHGKFFAHIRPCATMVEISQLIDPDLVIEIEATAWMGS